MMISIVLSVIGVIGFFGNRDLKASNYYTPEKKTG